MREPSRKSPQTRGNHLSFETLEDRVLLNADYRTIDGYGNNLAHPDWGSAGVQLDRYVASQYADGYSAPAGPLRPSPRAISNAVAAQERSVVNDRYLTDLVWQWGQFLDHDIGLTENVDPAQPMPVPVPTGDSYFDPDWTGTQTIEMYRSVYDVTTGTTTARQQLNQITAFIDASNVYGSDQDRADFLREFDGGKLKTSAGNLLPYNDGSQHNAGGQGTYLFVAGDVRANEQVGLTAMHTLFMREHNRLAAEISATEYPSADLSDPEIDEEIYQKARRIVGAQMQAITYNEFLPALLGDHGLGVYDDYDPSVNPGIHNVFSTAGYRLGHSMLSSQLLRLDNNGDPIPAGNLELRDAFFRPDRLVDQGGIDPLLKGLASQQMQEIDGKVIDDVRNFLFGQPGHGGFDLVSLNLQRGRDHGLASYNDTRVAFGLQPASSFREITSDRHVAKALASVYDTVDDVDLWIGAVAEDHLAVSSVGQLTREILVTQFEYLRRGDRYWYENTFATEEIAEINNTTLADIIQRNTDITDLQQNVFYDASILYYRLPDTGAPQEMYLVRAGDQLVIKDHDDTVVALQSWRQTTGIMLVGATGADEPGSTFVIDASHTIRAPGGIRVLGGENGQDTLEVQGRDAERWWGRDHIKVDQDQVRVGRSTFAYRDLGELRILGRGGNDNIRIMSTIPATLHVDGGDGNDFIVGGPGDEWLYGGAGHDRIIAGNGADYVDGGAGNDVILGRAGNNVLVGGAGHDRLYGGWGQDLLVGGYGRDLLHGGRGDDLLIGGAIDLDHAQLTDIMFEWTSPRDMASRLDNIRGTGVGPEYDNRLNGDSFLRPGDTVIDDGDRDRIIGSGDRDWVFFKLGSDFNYGHRRWDVADCL